MQSVFIHNGPYESISQTASPGLKFLQRFLPALDSLDPIAHPVASFIHPDARVVSDSNPPSKGTDVIALPERRSQHIQRFYHDLQRAWDIVPPDCSESDHRTVMFEATSGTVFKADPEQFEVRVKEFNVIELEAMRAGDSDSDEEGSRLQAVEIRTFSDSRPVQDQAVRLMQESTFREGKVAE